MRIFSSVSPSRMPVVVLVVAVMLVMASAGNAQDRGVVVITFEEQFTSPTTAVGVWSSRGAINDAGTRTESIVLTPGPLGTETVTGTVVLASPIGTFTGEFEGTVFAVNQPQAVAILRVVWTEGTGAYTGISGNATTVATIDRTTLVIRGADFGVINLPPSADGGRGR